MRRSSVMGGMLALGIGLMANTVSSAQPPGRLQVVELFTSQGCSSCPPANESVARLSERPDILALSFGVTYWDQLGWKDTFARKAFTERQWSYARGLRKDNVATPQVVVNGCVDVVGQRLSEIEGALRRAPMAPGPSLVLHGASVEVAGPAPGRPADVWLVRYDPNTIQVPIRRGENTGKTLPHKNVVRDLVRLGVWGGGPRTYALPTGAAGLRTAILIQAPAGGPILGAARS